MPIGSRSRSRPCPPERKSICKPLKFSHFLSRRICEAYASSLQHGPTGLARLSVTGHRGRKRRWLHLGQCKDFRLITRNFLPPSPGCSIPQNARPDSAKSNGFGNNGQSVLTDQGLLSSSPSTLSLDRLRPAPHQMGADGPEGERGIPGSGGSLPSREEG